MRAVVLSNEKKQIYDAFEINNIGYDDLMFHIADTYKNHKDSNKEKSGLVFTDKEGNLFGIEGIDIKECNNICNRITYNGYVDLTTYGEIQLLLTKEEHESLLIQLNSKYKVIK